ncbi:hypothetical protein [Epilithonimonas hominis]|uniref:hypothetical protein n=1 Tax=Epilithonimonas hominis TaxID=420404 RepID=UPI000ED0FD88|nr:hypothetical protein [Epilithonimonas hominis]HAP95424.1 hypothetical protein [Chryseobacterium sp.]
MKILSILISLFLLVSCSTVQNYTNNNLNQDYYKNKVLVFELHPSSQLIIAKSGPSAGIFMQPNTKETFKEAVIELANETKLNLKTNDTEESNVVVKIKDINWIFKLSSAEMITEINFITDNTEYPVNGNFKNFSGGSEKNNLKKSFKNAIYNFLIELQKK